MVNHSGLREGPLWVPPGGGMEFGSSAPENLVREFMEETGLKISVGKLAFITEYLNPPLHALEVFYHVSAIGGKLITGTDPESVPREQLIREVRFLTLSELDRLPPEAKHGVFRNLPTSGEIMALSGYFRI